MKDKLSTEELELKHLAPYLPYKLRIKYQERNQVMNMGQGHSRHWIGIKSVINWQDVNGEPPKPILRPLSDLAEFLDKSLFVEQWHDEWIEHFKDFQDKPEEANMLACPYDLFDHLVANHFDVFNLILQGKALDINTIEQ